MASPDIPPACPHGLRPGTTVCLHCRQEARIAARKRRYLIAVRIGVATMGGIVLLALAVGGIMSVAGNGASGEAGATADPSAVTPVAERSPAQPRQTTPSRTTAPGTAPAVPGGTSPAATSPVATSPVATPPAAAPGAAAPTVAADTVAPPVTAVPSIAEGRRELGDSMYAVREGNEVVVHFDTETLRTRYDWKFEGVVRATLPLVFGDAAREALDSVPTGRLVQGGDILNDLPTRGILVRLPTNAAIRVWPVTRPGRDGPLVVAYRAAAVR
jgi:hypothetical protein